MSTTIDWKLYAQQHSELGITDSFWLFWSGYLFETNEEKRSLWRQTDPMFNEHIEQLRRLRDSVREYLKKIS